MNKSLKLLFFFIISILATNAVNAQQVVYEGYVKDSATGEALPYASVCYTKVPIGTETDLQGFYRLETDHPVNSHIIEVSYLGYKTKRIDLNKHGHRINVALAPESSMLGEVTISASRKERYRRKGNPAVDLIKNVIAHKDSNDVRTIDRYSLKRYEKVILGLNDFKIPEDSIKQKKSMFNYLYEYIDSSEVSNHTYLPFSVRENLSDFSYQNSPHKNKQTIYAQNNKILMNILSEDVIDNVMAEGFSEVQIYDNNVDLFLTKFVSPLSAIAPAFYHYFIADTVIFDDGQKYVEMTFVPANTTDMGFTGSMFITTDSSYAVKRIVMDIPRDIKLNLVEKLRIEQDYEKTPDNKYALSHEKSISEMFLVKGLQGIYLKRDAFYSDYKWHDIDTKVFDRNENVLVTRDAKYQADTVWTSGRKSDLTRKEGSIDEMVSKLDKHAWFNIFEYLIRTCLEGYMTIGKKDLIDYGPVMSTYSHNYLEGSRIRIGGRTNPTLNPHWFLDAYCAYGFKDEKLKYKGELEYSFNEKKFGKIEFPRHSLMINYEYDCDVPSERFLGEGGHSLTRSFTKEKVTQYAYYRSQTFKYIKEYDNGFSYTFDLNHKVETAAGDLVYRYASDSSKVKNVENSTLGIELYYAPGVKYYQNKTNRYVMSYDVPQFRITQRMGLNDVLGSQYNYSRTDFSYKQEVYLTPLGYLDIAIDASKVWTKNPYPLLITPPANQSYIINADAFWLMGNMEFMTDQMVMGEIAYNMDGYILGRIPLIKKLQWKEMFRFRAMYGSLSDKNNPSKNGNDGLFLLPQDKHGRTTSYEMGNMPYMEVCAGLHNVFKILRIEYVRRLNYLDHLNAKKWSINVGVGLYF